MRIASRNARAGGQVGHAFAQERGQTRPRSGGRLRQEDELSGDVDLKQCVRSGNRPDVAYLAQRRFGEGATVPQR